MRERGLDRVPDPARFRRLLGVVFVGLAAPAAVLIHYAFGQLELDALRRERLAAEQTYRSIDDTLAAAIEIEQARGIDEYRFATRARDGSLERSPLSAFPPAARVPGTLGHFEVDADGALSTPLLPGREAAAAGLTLQPDERARRRALERRIATVLAANRLVRAGAADSSPAAAEVPARASSESASGADEARAAARRARETEEAERDAADAARGDAEAAADAARDDGEAVADAAASGRAQAFQRRLEALAGDGERGQAAFDALSAAPASGVRRELADAAIETVDADTDADATGTDSAQAHAGPQDAGLGTDDVRAALVTTFDVDVEPLQFSRLEESHFVLFRNAWRGRDRYVQGLVLDADEFLDGVIAAAFERDAVAPATMLTVSAGGETLARYGAAGGSTDDGSRTGTPLHTARLSPPLGGLELVFTASRLPRGAAHAVLVWSSVALFGVLVGGFIVVYRFGTQQIALARQQQDFVSAVSHELKTPLTSIRMYGEMLRSGWVDEARKKTYYDFIYAEGERLSRLIDNVLRLARLSHGGPSVTLEALTVAAIVDTIRSKVATPLEQAGFTLAVEQPAELDDVRVSVDPDALAQVFINLADNAVKFARDSARHELVLRVARHGDESIVFALRDFGPGLPPRELKRLFRLFYRPDNELTRTTAGTGIGLALVRQLVAAMGGSVDVNNREPGAEFRIIMRREQSVQRLQAGV